MENARECQLIKIEDGIIHYMNTDGNEGTVPLPEGELGEVIANLSRRGLDVLILIETTNGQEEVTSFRCPSLKRKAKCVIL
ncbi:uncharacterized protein B0J16DRAFT_336435 [Fusarium flagelliforme]|uniref:uncharacterized protein n=1 Tax=Fusarium flagelliforme TaxID=2675880 RepID=UPI001E8EAD73|nr:uncharacterized protein B0J16DRAFT_336435 [Fusarium flagelliforme]KAH7188084.1 hypothetical protein B0J16DRAFT_336435 [Fusarium flagelliforme]